MALTGNVLVYTGYDPISLTCSTSEAISKGDALMMSGDRTVTRCTSATAAIIGVTKEDSFHTDVNGVVQYNSCVQVEAFKRFLFAKVNTTGTTYGVLLKGGATAGQLEVAADLATASAVVIDGTAKDTNYKLVALL